jgi:hypothetical protein
MSLKICGDLEHVIINNDDEYLVEENQHDDIIAKEESIQARESQLDEILNELAIELPSESLSKDDYEEYSDDGK